MLHVPQEVLERRARRLAAALERAVSGLRAEVVRGEGEVGGGALPLARLPGWVVALADRGRTPDTLEAVARQAAPPVIGYIRGDRFRLDVRTLTDEDVDELAHSMARALGSGAGVERE